jgi:hypothetical protein
MKINNIELTYFINYLEKTVHLKDLNHFRNRYLLNEVSPSFKKKIIESESLLTDVLGFEWLIYCSDGLVMEYKDYNLTFVTKEDKRLHKPFLSLKKPL